LTERKQACDIYKNPKRKLSKLIALAVEKWHSHLPQHIWVTVVPINSNTFLGNISLADVQWPNWPYMPAPNVKTPPSRVKAAVWSIPHLMYVTRWNRKLFNWVGWGRSVVSPSPNCPKEFFPQP
jgi:hypothetical protein